MLLSLNPLSHISNLIIDIYYILSVAGTAVFPGYDVLRVNKDKELWELFSEVITSDMACWFSFTPPQTCFKIRKVISRSF